MDQDFKIAELGEKPEIKGGTLGETIVDEVSAQEVTITHGGVHEVRAATVSCGRQGPTPSAPIT